MPDVLAEARHHLETLPRQMPERYATDLITKLADEVARLRLTADECEAIEWGAQFLIDNKMAKKSATLRYLLARHK